MNSRRFVSLTLMFSILGMLVSSIVLYIVPQGRVAYWSNWSLWGLTKTQWGNLHTNLGLMMVIAAFFHIYFNWGPIKVYLKNKARELKVFTPEFNGALILFVIVTLGTQAAWPPLAWIQLGAEKIKDRGAKNLGEPPYGHAEESSLRAFLRNVGIEPDQARQNMEAVGIEVEDPQITIKDLAADHNMTPKALYALMKGPENEESSPEQKILPTAMPMGSGRKTLVWFCSEYGQDLKEAVTILEAAGWQVDSESTLREIAAVNDKEPLDLLDTLRQGLEN